jgi:putative nucleotidyltransferase with HDIG domain
LRRDTNHSKKNKALYAGRWIARLRGKIIGQGGTPEQALQAAKAARHKETPEVEFVPMTSPFLIPPVLDRIRQATPPDVSMYLVGGAVRDLLLARPLHDYDFALPGDALEIGRKIANRLEAAYYPLDVERQTARVILTDEQGKRNVLDFAAYREADLDSDLRARDFTINAMALDVRAPQQLLDPLGGAADLQAQILRACSPNTFTNDPVRVLRGIRLAAKLGLQIQPETRQWMRAAISGLERVSPERQRDELMRILRGKQPHTAVRALEMLGVFPYVFPELPAMDGVTQSPPHVKDVWNHTLDTLRVLEGITNQLSTAHDPEASGNLMLGLLSMRLGRYREKIKAHLENELVTERPVRELLFLAGLYHDVAKPQTRSVEENGRIRFFNHNEVGAEIITRRAAAFRLSNLETDRLATIVRHHMRPSFLSHAESGPSKRAIYRFFRDTGEAGVDICLLSLADVWATYGSTLTQERWAAQVETVRVLLEAWWERPKEQVHPPALISGHDLLNDLELKPGPMIGEILEAVREAQAEGKVRSREEALQEALQFVQEYLS